MKVCVFQGKFKNKKVVVKSITKNEKGDLLASCSDDESVIANARFLATQAKDNASYYEHSTIGYNYRMSNISAAIGVGQLQVLDQRVKARRANHAYYEDLFKEVEGVSFLKEPNGFFSNRWLTCVVFDQDKNHKLNPDKFRLHLEQDQIESRPLWKPMHLQPIYKSELYFGGDIAEQLFQKGICLPSGSNLTSQDKERIQKSIQSFLNS